MNISNGDMVELSDQFVPFSRLYKWYVEFFMESEISFTNGTNYNVRTQIFFLPIQAVGPTLAMDRVAGFPYQISSAAMFIVCIVYSSLGGFKAVLWTDVLQASVMAITVVSIATCGVIEAGGIPAIWERSQVTGRTWIGR